MEDHAAILRELDMNVSLKDQKKQTIIRPIRK